MTMTNTDNKPSRPLFTLPALCFTVISAFAVSGCSTTTAPYVGNRVEHVERMAPVGDVPYTGDAPYLRAAQDYSQRGRSSYISGGGYYPY